jgi:hypothetical protein
MKKQWENNSKTTSPPKKIFTTDRGSCCLKAHPFTSEFVLTNEETRFMVAHATACKPNEMPTLCSCGQPLNLSHSTSCGPNQLTRPNRLQARFVTMAREQGCTIEQNVRLDADDAKKQLEPDIIFYLVGAHRLKRTSPSSTPMRHRMSRARNAQLQEQHSH